VPPGVEGRRARGERRCGIVDVLRCGEHDKPLSSSWRTSGKGEGSPVHGRPGEERTSLSIAGMASTGARTVHKARRWGVVLGVPTPTGLSLPGASARRPRAPAGPTHRSGHGLGGRQHGKPSERRDRGAMDAFPAAPFQVNGFQPCRSCAAHHLGSDEVLLSAGCRILRLQLAHAMECVENCMALLTTLFHIIYGIRFILYNSSQ
jgi:hypothetical protein